MEASLKMGLVAALAAGCLFGVIVALEGAVSKVVGAINASVLEHFFGGSIAIIFVSVLLIQRRVVISEIRSIIPVSILLGILVFGAVATVAFAIPRTGIALGNFAVVFGQLVVAVVIDTVGIGGLERVPLSPQRILGLIVMMVGIYLIIPKNG